MGKPTVTPQTMGAESATAEAVSVEGPGAGTATVAGSQESTVSLQGAQSADPQSASSVSSNAQSPNGQAQSPIGHALPQEILDLVGDIEPIKKLTPDEVSNVAAIAGVQDKRLKLQRVLEIWSNYYKHERNLREKIAALVFKILLVEMLFAMAAFFGIGLGWLHVDTWVADVFFVGVFTQVSGMAYWVVKSLFPQPTSDPLSQINDIVTKL